VTGVQGRQLDGFIARPVQAVSVSVAALALAVGLIMSTGPRDISTPVQAANAGYVQGHVLYAGQAPLADHVSYTTVVSASSESSNIQVK
jgi:hypothetical protein